MRAHIGAVASMALAANAFLVPPYLATDSLGDDRIMETLANDPFQRSVALECPGCSVATKEGETLAWRHAEEGNAFLLNFEVGPSQDTITLGGSQIWPPERGVPHFFSLTQIVPDANPDAGMSMRVTDYSFSFIKAETVSEEGTDLINILIRINEIEHQRVNPPMLTVNLLKNIDGRVMIASFEAEAPREDSPVEQEKPKEKECNEWSLICKLRAILADKYDGAKKAMGKGCRKHKGAGHGKPHGKPPHFGEDGPGGPEGHHGHHGPGGKDGPGGPGGHHGPGGEDGPGGPEGHHRPHGPGGKHGPGGPEGRPGHGRPGHGHHQKMHSFISTAFFTILVPILFGIFIGTITYLVGMALGCTIAIIVAKVRGYGPYQAIALEDEEEHVESNGDKEFPSEKAGYVDVPEYEAPPVYEEATTEEATTPETPRA